MQMAIVVVEGTDGTTKYFGPFANGERATAWGFEHCRNYSWHWEPLWSVDKVEDAE